MCAHKHSLVIFSEFLLKFSDIFWIFLKFSETFRVFLKFSEIVRFFLKDPEKIRKDPERSGKIRKDPEILSDIFWFFFWNFLKCFEIFRKKSGKDPESSGKFRKVLESSGKVSEIKNKQKKTEKNFKNTRI